MNSAAVLGLIEHSAVYLAALFFFAAYPIVTSIMWMTTAFFFRQRWEGGIDAQMPPDERLSVSILIPAHNEEAVLASALTAACAINYPNYEVVVIDDGSNDGTREIIREFAASGKVRSIIKHTNQGKAMALNDALPCLNGDVILMMDADAEPDPQILRWIMPHFASARVAAVTGNPRVKNVDTFLARLQLIEFTSIVSLLRRSQRIWGRIVTVSGVIAAFRRSALFDVGGFSPDMATEDIELTWKLQKRFWDIRYEPRALVWMTVPSSYRAHFKQRLRWARGLMQVLRRHSEVITKWKYRRMWPIFVESVLSTLWALCFVSLSMIWIVSYSLGVPPVGAHPIPNFWGMVIATVCILQLIVGTVIDSSYDRDTIRYFPYAVFYPIVYWIVLQLAAVVALPHLFKNPRHKAVLWTTRRTKLEP